MAILVGGRKALQARRMLGINDDPGRVADALIGTVEIAERLKHQPDARLLDDVENIDRRKLCLQAGVLVRRSFHAVGGWPAWLAWSAIRHRANPDPDCRADQRLYLCPGSLFGRQGCRPGRV